MEEFKFKDAVIRLKKGDITLEETEAIVNAANASLTGGGGVDGAIHRAAGPTLLEECLGIIKKIGSLPTGKSVITGGGNLRAKYVIHTVGPVWGSSKEEEKLRSSYRESLNAAAEKKIRSISFPSISTGAYLYPVEKASRIAADEVLKFLEENSSVKEVNFVLFTLDVYECYLNAFKKAIDERNNL